jgi:membrane-bound lytic murein transglycosylase F
MLAQKLADTLGVRLRVELCRDTLEVQRKLKLGDGDLSVSLTVDGNHALWAVAPGKPLLSQKVRQWYQPPMLLRVRQEEDFLLSSRSVRRHVFSPMLDRRGGIISRWDGLFIKYSKPLRWDWRLMAAQCYQESTFDPNARSWAGACGLMQIMPSTADQIGLERSRIMQPEDNVAAAARLLGQLEGKFSDVSPRTNRLPFVLAAYNGGYHHVRDAMALARKHGRNSESWEEVKTYILALQQPQYYNDSVVQYGYLRGSETAAYVDDILARWRQYRHVHTHHK